MVHPPQNNKQKQSSRSPHTQHTYHHFPELTELNKVQTPPGVNMSPDMLLFGHIFGCLSVLASYYISSIVGGNSV